MSEKRSASAKQPQGGGERHSLGRPMAYAEDVGVLALGVLALVTALGLAGWTRGQWVDAWSILLWRWMGWGAVITPMAFGLGVFLLVRHRMGTETHISWARIIGFEVGLIGLLGLLSILDGLSLPRAEAGEGGGLIGWGIGTLLEGYLGRWGSGGLLAGLALGGMAHALSKLWKAIGSWFGARRGAGDRASRTIVQAGAQAEPMLETDRPIKRRAKPARSVPRQYRKNFRLPEIKEESAEGLAERDERLPPLDLLAGGEAVRVTAKEINLAAGLIEKTLDDFGLPVHVAGFRTGPAVTQFAVEPGYIDQSTAEGEIRRSKVRVSQISALAKDLALALSAPSLRIEAPVPGRSYVGIEVPNRKPGLVRLRPIIESKAFRSIASPLAIALGRDVAGDPVAADLAAMPHLLIAGTTGSGKSVCITAIAACLVANNTPDDLRLVMIDPKMVELIRFNGLPHLLGRVETELQRIVPVLRWCTVEMDRRYRLLEEEKVRDMDAFNRKMRTRRAGAHIPRIVVMIDELADLMMMAPDQTERVLVRLAQMARAVGIHLVVATQRPSTDILTGLIKANFPARIAFAVASSVDSRVILDKPGAETLLGRGDMLFLSPEAAAGVRVQGSFASDSEVERLVEYWQQAMAPGESEQAEGAPWEELIRRRAALEERDDILERAIELVKQTRQASASMLQRRLRIGYPRAARLMDELEDLGVVGAPQSGGKTREVLIDKDHDPLAAREDDAPSEVI